MKEQTHNDPEKWSNLRNETKNWWMQAERDLKSAKNALKSKDYYLVAFLCQQAVEKSLKALILHGKREFSLSHSLIYLGKSVGIPDAFHSFLRDLTPQYTITRYPNATGEVPFELYDEEIASHFLKKSEEVLQWIEKQLKSPEDSSEN